MKNILKTSAAAMVVAMMAQVPASAQEAASWEVYTKDDAGPKTPAQAAQESEIRAFRAEMAAALASCDRAKLLDMYAPDYFVQEGSGWAFDREEAIAACGNTTWSTGVEDADPLTMTIRSLGDDAAVATGTTRLARGSNTPMVRWLVMYGKNADGDWQQAYAQVHRAPPAPPGLPDVGGARLAGRPGTPPISMLPLTPEWFTQLAKDQPLDTDRNEKLVGEVEAWADAFRAAAASKDIDRIDNFYDEHFTMTHGSGHVEGRASRMGGAAQRGVVAELMPPIAQSVRSVGDDGAVYVTIVPFAFDNGWKGFLRTAMALERSPDTDSAGWQLATLQVNSYWNDFPLGDLRVPSGCEMPPIGNPTVVEPDPDC